MSETIENLGVPPGTVSSVTEALDQLIKAALDGTFANGTSGAYAGYVDAIADASKPVDEVPPLDFTASAIARLSASVFPRLR